MQDEREKKALNKEVRKALIDRDWSNTNLAKEMGISRMCLNDVLNFRKGTVTRMEQIKDILRLK